MSDDEYFSLDIDVPDDFPGEEEDNLFPEDEKSTSQTESKVDKSDILKLVLSSADLSSLKETGTVLLGEEDLLILVEKARKSAESPEDGGALELLEMENQTMQDDMRNLQGTVQQLELANNELKATVQHLLQTYETALSEKNDLTAHNHVLELEVKQLRQRCDEAVETATQLVLSNQGLQATVDNTTTALKALEEKYTEVENDLGQAQGNAERLKRVATEKLRKASAEYLRVKSAENEKQEIIGQLRDDLERESQLRQEHEVKLKKLNTDITKNKKSLSDVSAQLKEKSLEIVTQSSILEEQANEVSSLKNRVDELFALNESYKKQILQSREAAHQLDQVRLQLSSREQETQALKASLGRYEVKNDKLKSRLFDLLQTEETLRAQLDAGGGDALALLPPSPGGPSIAKLSKEVIELQDALDKKESENKELMGICDGLVAQVEALSLK